MKMLGTVAVGIVRESRKFSGRPYVGRIALRAHCAVIFAIAQLSCLLLGRQTLMGSLPFLAHPVTKLVFAIVGAALLFLFGL